MVVQVIESPLKRGKSSDLQQLFRGMSSVLYSVVSFGFPCRGF